MDRYIRHLLVIGEENVKKLRNCKVLLVGLGGLGSLIAYYLTCLGVKELHIIDHDIVQISDLNRQILYTVNDLGLKKVYVASKKLKSLNPEVEIIEYDFQLNEDNAIELTKNVDIVIDALDNWKSRLILNKACILNRKVLIHGAVSDWIGQVTTVIPCKTPCLQDLYLITKPKDRDVIPVMPQTVGVIASIQVNEFVKYVINQGELLTGKLLIIDLLTYSKYIVSFEKQKDCICNSICK